MSQPGYYKLINESTLLFFDIGPSWPPLGYFPPAAPRPHALQALHTCRTFTLRLLLCHLDGAKGWTAQQVGVESVFGICRDQQQPWSRQQFPTGRRCRSRSARLRHSSRWVLGLTKLLVMDCIQSVVIPNSRYFVTSSVSSIWEKSFYMLTLLICWFYLFVVL